MKRSVCALVSGGLDSSVMLAELAKTCRRVYPVYVRQGFVWERAELRHLRRYLRASSSWERISSATDRGYKPLPQAIQPLTVLDLPARDLYRNHWSTTGRRVPGAKTRDEAVYLPGRNLMLLSKAAVFCALRGIPVIAVGSLGHNPFPDATPKFFRDFARLSGVQVVAPFRSLTKEQVIRRGRNLPLHLTFSCIAPKHGRPCGRCNKCAERRHASRRVGVVL